MPESRGQLFLTGRNDENVVARIWRADNLRTFLVQMLIELDVKPRGCLADPVPDQWRVFADASGEHQRVDPPSAAASDPISRPTR